MRYFCIFLSISFLFSYSSQVTQTSEIPLPLSQSETGTILALGDSLTAGYEVVESENYPTQLSEVLKENGYNYEIINAGVSGDTSQNLLERADLYLDQNPDIVILVIGGNDGLRGLGTKDMKENIQKIINIFQSSGAKIVLGGMDVPLNMGLEYRAQFRQVYQDIAQENTDIFFLPFFLEGVAGDPSLNISDKIHPNKEGYRLIVSNLFTFLKDENIIQK